MSITQMVYEKLRIFKWFILMRQVSWIVTGINVKGFKEGEIEFPPTYKFDKNRDTYDTSTKLRIPSWTDRILWKTRKSSNAQSVSLLYYASIASVKISDHRPVAAGFDVDLHHLRSQCQGENIIIKRKSRFCSIQWKGEKYNPRRERIRAVGKWFSNGIYTCRVAVN